MEAGIKYIEKIYQRENGTEILIKMKTECHTSEELEEALSFMAECSHQFYLDAGNTFRCTP